jgi:hypothetical protein
VIKGSRKRRLVLPIPDKELSGYNPPFEHYNYDALEDYCGCFLCRDVEYQMAIVRKLEPDPEITHDMNCPCSNCKHVRKEKSALTAYSIRRDCYSELSYLVRNKKWRNEFLIWFLAILLSPQSQSYWSAVVDSLPLSHWIERWAGETGRL